MFPRLMKVKRGDQEYQYLKFVRTYRDGKRVRHQVVASLGNVLNIAEADIDNIINGLCRLFRRPAPGEAPEFVDAKDYGDIHVMVHLWHELKIAQSIAKQARQSKHEFDIEKHIRCMVFNRLSDPRSKLALLSWLETVHIPEVERSELEYHHLLRAMDFLIEHKEQIERDLCNSVLTLFDQKLDLVFYDLTSSYFETEITDELRKYGYSRDHRSDRPQLTIGMVTTRDGIPVHHQVFPGNTADKTTVQTIVASLKENFPIGRAVFVGDRGMLTKANIEYLESEGLDYILAVNVRNDKDAEEILHGFEYEVDEARAKWRKEAQTFRETGELPEGISSEEELYANQRLVDEQEVNGRRLVVEHSETIAKTSARKRHERLEKTQSGMAMVVGRLEEQDAGRKVKGRKLSETGAHKKMLELVDRKGIRDAYKLSIDDGYLKIEMDDAALQWESVLDGKLVIETNNKELTAPEVVSQYRDLKEIEASFRVLKSSVELRPMYHWSPRRIESHVFICVLALTMERVMRLRLRNAGRNMEVGHALGRLRTVRRITAKTAGGTAAGLTTANSEQLSLFKALGIPAPKLQDFT